MTKHTRRVRAGGPPPDDLPIQMIVPEEKPIGFAVAVVLLIISAIATATWLLVQVL